MKELEKGQKVTYGHVDGTITDIIGDTVLVKLEDGKEYSLRPSQLTITAPEALKAYTKAQLKRMEFLEALAKDMLEAGVSELSIKNGKIDKFQAKESLEEKIVKFQEEAKTEADKAMAIAETKAREEFESENREE